jgi:O-antigen ligase
MDVIVLVVPLAVAIVNPGTGLFSGFVTAIMAIAFVAVRHGAQCRLGLVDWMALYAAALVVASPLWAYEPSLTRSASHNGATALVYFVAMRLVLRAPGDFVLFGRLIIFACSIYAIYFLINAKTSSLGGSRLSVDFANENYTGAILAFGAVIAAFFAVYSPTRSLWQVLSLAGFAVDGSALFHTGSRASAAGVVVALAVLILMRKYWKVAQCVGLLSIAAGFVVAFIPESARLLIAASAPFSSYQTFSRGQQSIYDLSGREEIWRSTREIVSDSWILGYGPEGYRLRGPTQILAHSWGLDYMASVGIVGTCLLAAVILLAFTGIGIRSAPANGRLSSLWNVSTAFSVLPSLALSTHQWTLWAWAGFALWSRSHVLDVERRRHR